MSHGNKKCKIFSLKKKSSPGLFELFLVNSELSGYTRVNITAKSTREIMVTFIIE